MRHKYLVFGGLLLVLTLLCGPTKAMGPPKLPDIDFSYAGYRAAERSLPQAPVVRSLSPSGKDDTARIQSALDAVGLLTPDASGLRGAVLLKPGVYHLRHPIYLSDAGVVLRGSGSGPQGSHLRFGGKPGFGIVVESPHRPTLGRPTFVVSPTIRPGAMALEVRSASGFQPYQIIHISRAMDAAFAQRLGEGASSLPEGTQTFERTIVAIENNVLYLDAPLTDILDEDVVGRGQLWVSLATWPERLREVGVEHLSASAPLKTAPIQQPSFGFVSFNKIQDAWLHDVSVADFAAGVVHVGRDARRITIQNVHSRRSRPQSLAFGYPVDFLLEGQQVLMQGLDCEGDDVAFVALGPYTPGPNVVRQVEAHGNGRAIISPLAPWTTGLLLEQIFLPGGTVGFGWGPWRFAGSGWSGSQGWIYNSSAKAFAIAAPPLGSNVCIGCEGRLLHEHEHGVYSDLDPDTTPPSIFYTQLQQRLGAAQADAIAAVLSVEDP